MFKNTRMFSSGSNATSLIASRINIKAMLMMLVMMFVGFGIFGGNAFAAGMPEPSVEGDTITYTISEGSVDWEAIPLESNKHYIVNFSGGTITLPSSSFWDNNYGMFYIDSATDLTGTTVDINMSGGTLKTGDSCLVGDHNSHHNEIGVTNNNFNFNFTGGTVEGELTGIYEIVDEDYIFDSNHIAANFKNVTITGGVNIIKYTNFDVDYNSTHNTIDLTIDGNTSIGGNLIGINGGTPTDNSSDLDNHHGDVSNTTINLYAKGGTVNGKFYFNTTRNHGENTILNVYNLNTQFRGYPNGNADLESQFTSGGWVTGLFNSWNDSARIYDKRVVTSPDENATTGTGTNNADGTVTVQIPITKLMHMNAADATILNDYTFTMTPAEAVHTQDSYTGSTSPAQTDNTVTIHKEAFNRIAELNSNNNKVVISNVNNNGASGVDNDVFTLTFTNGQIGQFHYRVIENPITSDLQSGVTQDSTLYDIVVTIENKDPNNITSGEVKFAGVTMSTSTDGGESWTKTNTSESTKSDRGGAGVDINNAKFTNTFHTADVLVDKTVRGSLGDKTKDFTFTFNVMGTGIPTTYKLYKTNAANETAEPVDVQNGSTFTLKHGESAKVMGLPEGAMYRIMEQGVVDYKTNINANLGDSDYNEYYTVNFHNGATYAFGMNGDAYSDANASTGGAGEDILVSTAPDALSMVDITSASNLDEHHFTNMKGQLIPTGLIENMASFLGLALLAAFAIGYMLYKKKKDTVSEEA